MTETKSKFREVFVDISSACRNLPRKCAVVLSRQQCLPCTVWLCRTRHLVTSYGMMHSFWS